MADTEVKWHYESEPVSGFETREPWEINIYETVDGNESCIAHMTNSGNQTQAKAAIMASGLDMLAALKNIQAAKINADLKSCAAKLDALIEIGKLANAAIRKLESAA